MKDSYIGKRMRSTFHVDVCTKTITFVGKLNDAKPFFKEVVKLGVHGTIVDSRSIQLDSEKDLDLILAHIPGGKHLRAVKHRCSLGLPTETPSPSADVIQFANVFSIPSPPPAVAPPPAPPSDAMLNMYKQIVARAGSMMHF